jgi:iron-sulfur cluster repair protein YtfE (RIC family)
MRCTELLAQQHIRLTTIFDELEVTGDSEERLRLAAHLAEQLKLHAAVEEDVFYPAMSALGADAAEIVTESLEAHNAVDVLLDELMGTHLTPATVGGLRDLVQRHMEDEETRLFPIAARLDEDAQNDLALRIEGYSREEENSELGVEDAGP